MHGYKEREMKRLKTKFPWLNDFNNYYNPWGDKLKPTGKSSKKDIQILKENGYEWDGYYWSKTKRA